MTVASGWLGLLLLLKSVRSRSAEQRGMQSGNCFNRTRRERAAAGPVRCFCRRSARDRGIGCGAGGLLYLLHVPILFVRWSMAGCRRNACSLRSITASCYWEAIQRRVRSWRRRVFRAGYARRVLIPECHVPASDVEAGSTGDRRDRAQGLVGARSPCGTRIQLLKGPVDSAPATQRSGATLPTTWPQIRTPQHRRRDEQLHILAGCGLLFRRLLARLIEARCMSSRARPTTLVRTTGGRRRTASCRYLSEYAKLCRDYCW